jgi:TIR domain
MMHGQRLLGQALSPTRDVPPFVRKLRPLLKRATVFLSHAAGDLVIARQIYDALTEQDYRVFLDFNSIPPGLRWQTEVQSSLEDAVEHGFALLLLSPDYLCTAYCEKEREMALKSLGSRATSNIVPVIVRDPDYVYHRLPANLHNL